MACTTTTSLASRHAPWWQTASWIGLLLLGAFNLYAAAADLAADAGTGLPSDHAGTFTSLSGRTWASFKAAQPGAAHYITLVERGYALHELVFAILFVIIVAIPLRAGQRWAWWGCWTVLIAYLSYTFTFGVHDHAILARSLIGRLPGSVCGDLHYGFAEPGHHVTLCGIVAPSPAGQVDCKDLAPRGHRFLAVTSAEGRDGQQVSLNLTVLAGAAVAQPAGHEL